MSKLLESKASINAGSKVDASLNQLVGIPEVRK
jgi:hypothetical protein